jgi:integrase
MVFKPATSKYWWYKFTWRGEIVRESTKQTNRRVAEQMAAARKTQPAKGEVGIRDLKPAPTLAEFVKNEFRPFIERTHAEKKKTLLHYQYASSILLAHAPVAHARVDKISADLIGGLVESMQGRGLSVVTVNRALGCLRRMLKLAVEWKTIRAPDSPIRLLPGEKLRERVLTAEEDAAYFAAARQIGAAIVQEYERALDGIQATQRGEKPIAPRDPYLLHDLSTILVECALRPEEAYGLRRSEVQDGALHVASKTPAGRRAVPLSDAALEILETRRQAALSPVWGFPAPTASGHAEQTTLKGRHAAACTTAGLAAFPAVHLPAHMPDAMGRTHGSVHAGPPRRPCELRHDAALRASGGSDGSRCDEAGGCCAGWH